MATNTIAKPAVKKVDNANLEMKDGVQMRRVHVASHIENVKGKEQTHKEYSYLVPVKAK